jgi:hypothetical protein
VNSPREGGVRSLFDDATDHHHLNKLDQPYQVFCLAFRAFSRNTLQGFVTLAVWPFVIDDCTLHDKEGKRWVSFPARSYTDTEGKLRWVSWLGIREKSEFFRFQKAALAAIDAFRAAPGEEAP